MGVALGIDPTKVRTSAEGPEFKLGTIGYETDNPPIPTAAMGVTGGSGNGTGASGKVFMYCQANGAWTGNGSVVAIDPETFDSVATVAATGDAGTGMHKPVGIAQAAVADNGFGWLQIYGQTAIDVAASAVKFTQLNVTATAGRLDDAVGITLNIVVGAVLTTTATSAAVTAGFVNYPYLGAKSA